MTIWWKIQEDDSCCVASRKNNFGRAFRESQKIQPMPDKSQAILEDVFFRIVK
jgi:hypothetical protein